MNRRHPFLLILTVIVAISTADGSPELVEAIKNGDLSQVEFELGNNAADPNYVDGDGVTALCHALLHFDDDTQIVEKLLQKYNASVDLSTKLPNSHFLLKGVPPISVASYLGSPVLVDALLSHGANVNLTGEAAAEVVTYQNLNPLHFAILGDLNEDVVESLVNAGVCANCRVAMLGGLELSPIDFAMQMGLSQSDIAKLTAGGVEPSTSVLPGVSGVTPLMLAALTGRTDLLSDFLVTPLDEDTSGSTALTYASILGQWDAVAALEAKASPQELEAAAPRTFLDALRTQNVARVSAFLAKVDVATYDAALFQEMLGVASRNVDDPDIIKLLLIDEGVNPDSMTYPIPENSWAMPWISDAAFHNNAPLVKALLDVSADVDLVDSSGMTSLLWAARGGADEALQLILDSTSDVNAATPKAVACAEIVSDLSIFSLLHKHGWNRYQNCPEMPGSSVSNPILFEPGDILMNSAECPMPPYAAGSPSTCADFAGNLNYNLRCRLYANESITLRLTNDQAADVQVMVCPSPCDDSSVICAVSSEGVATVTYANDRNEAIDLGVHISVPDSRTWYLETMLDRPSLPPSDINSILDKLKRR